MKGEGNRRGTPQFSILAMPLDQRKTVFELERELGVQLLLVRSSIRYTRSSLGGSQREYVRYVHN